MKSLVSIMVVCVFVVGMSGCAKTMGELRADSDAVVDNAVGDATSVLNTVATIAKQVIKVGFAGYDLVKKMLDDTKDNAGTVTGGVIGTKPSQ